MTKGRLEAFSDGVFAILITILVLELHVPHEGDLAALRALVPTFLGYALSFLFIGVYWNNHHHMLHLAKRINGKVLWANLHLLFWLSLVPFTTGWMGETHFATLPTAAYGLDMFVSGLAYVILQTTLVNAQGETSKLRDAIGADLKGKASAVLLAAGVPLAFVHVFIAGGLYVFVVLIWLVPDKRIEKHFEESDSAKSE